LKAEIYERCEECFNEDLMRSKKNTKEKGNIHEFFGDYYVEIGIFE
jgi:hypothetical protein